MEPGPLQRISKFKEVHGETYVCDAYWFWCPGCDEAHQYRVGGGEGPRWTFNGNMEKPTFTPSLLHAGHRKEGSDKLLGQCHLFLTDGMLNFCGDCTHELKGQSVPLPELPDWLRRQ